MTRTRRGPAPVGDVRSALAETSLPFGYGADLGMVRGAPHDDDPAVGYVISLWVAPEARGRGVGEALAAEVVTWARARGLRRIILDVGALPAPHESVCEVQMRLDLDV